MSSRVHRNWIVHLDLIIMQEIDSWSDRNRDIPVASKRLADVLISTSSQFKLQGVVEFCCEKNFGEWKREIPGVEQLS